MQNRTFTISLIIIGLLSLFVSSVSAIDTNMTIANGTLILLFSFFILSFGIYKEDSIIGFLCCFGSAFIFLTAWYNNLYDSTLNPYIIIIVFIALAIGAYKVFITYTDNTKPK